MVIRNIPNVSPSAVDLFLALHLEYHEDLVTLLSTATVAYVELEYEAMRRDGLLYWSLPNNILYIGHHKK